MRYGFICDPVVRQMGGGKVMRLPIRALMGKHTTPSTWVGPKKNGPQYFVGEIELDPMRLPVLKRTAEAQRVRVTFFTDLNTRIPAVFREELKARFPDLPFPRADDTEQSYLERCCQAVYAGQGFEQVRDLLSDKLRARV